MANEEVFPNIVDFARLSEDCYNAKASDQELQQIPDWTCIATANYSDGYRGAAYKRNSTKHIVIAHGGTDVSLWRPIETLMDFSTDLMDVLLGPDSIIGKIISAPAKLPRKTIDKIKIFFKRTCSEKALGDIINSSQITSALAFTLEIVHLYRSSEYLISITGHSLGGWLAQICTLCLEYPAILSKQEKLLNERKRKLSFHFNQSFTLSKGNFTLEPLHLHCVVFESPGCKRAFANILEHKFRRYDWENKLEWEKRLNTLDIFVIISPFSWVSTTDEHVGYLLYADMKNSHSIADMIEYLSKDSSKFFEVKEFHRFKNAELGDQVYLQNWFLGKLSECSCRASVFTSQQKKILSYAQIILEWKRKHLLDNSKIGIFNKELETAAVINELNQILTDVKFEISDDNPFIKFRTVDKTSIRGMNSNRALVAKKLIEELLTKCRQNPAWKASCLKKTMNILPGCRQQIYENQCYKYLKKIPSFGQVSCRPDLLYSTIMKFEKSDSKVLKIRVSHGGNFKRTCMAYIVHLYVHHFDRKAGSLFLNFENLEKLTENLDMKLIFTNQPELKLIVLERDESRVCEIVEAMERNVALGNGYQKLILISDECGESVGDIPSIQFKDLTDKCKTFLMSYKLDILGETISLGKDKTDTSVAYLMDDLNIEKFLNVDDGSTILQILDGKTINVRNENLPKLPKYYISRKLFFNHLDPFKVCKVHGKFSEPIFLSCSNEEEKRMAASRFSFLKDKSLLHIIKKPCNKLDFYHACKSVTATNAHLFKWNELILELEYQLSKGKPCREVLSDYLGEMSEDNILEMPSDIVILADEPGMGKSAAIINLYLKFRESIKIHSQFRWPVYIDLNAFKLDLLNPGCGEKSTYLNFLNKATNIQNESATIAFFEFCLENACGINFFIDSYDEISKPGQTFIANMLLWLKELNPEIRIWIATRVHAKDELENKLQARAHRFHRIGEYDQVKYLTQYWSDAIHSNNVSEITLEKREKISREFAECAIQETKIILRTNVTFIGIPQQLILLAAAHEETIISIAGPGMLIHKLENVDVTNTNLFKNAIKIKSIHELYKLYDKTRVDMWLKKYPNMMPGTEESERQKIDKIHCIAGFLSLSNSLFPDGPIITIEKLTTMYCEEANRVGLFQISFRSAVIHIPSQLYKRIDKLKNRIDSKAGPTNIIVLILDNSRPDNVECKKLMDLLQKLTTAKVVIFAQVCYIDEDNKKLDNTQLVHYFRESGDLNFAWQCSKFGLQVLHYGAADVCEEIFELEIRFSHQTIAEYFTAKQLFTMINEGKVDDKQAAIEFLKNNYYKPEFNKVRYFLDSFLCPDIPSLRNLEVFIATDKTREEKIKYLQNQFCPLDWEYTDGLGRNLLHFAAAYGDHQCGIFWIVAKNPKLLDQLDEMGVSWISYLLLAEYFKLEGCVGVETTKDILHKYSSQDLNEGNDIKVNLLQDFCKTIRGVSYEDIMWFYLSLFGELTPFEKGPYGDNFYTGNYGPKFFDSDDNVQALLNILSIEGEVERLKLWLNVEISWVISSLKEKQNQQEVNETLALVKFVVYVYRHNYEANREKANKWLLELCGTASDIDSESAVWFLENVIFSANEIELLSDKDSVSLKQKFDNLLLKLVQKNFQRNYEMTFYILSADLEITLWNNYEDSEKEMMMKIIRAQNYYSFCRIAFCKGESLHALTAFANSRGLNVIIRKVLAKIFDLLVANKNSENIHYTWELIAEEDREHVWNANFSANCDSKFSWPRGLKDWICIFDGQNSSWRRRYTEDIDEYDALELFSEIERFEPLPEQRAILS